MIKFIRHRPNWFRLILVISLSLGLGWPVVTVWPAAQPSTSTDSSGEERASPTWPAYRHDDERTARVSISLEFPLQLSWRFMPMKGPAPAWPPPARQDFWNGFRGLKARVGFDRAYQVVSDGKRVFFGTSSDDRIVCLDAHTGKLVWMFFASGPVRLAPRLVDDRLIFGADDGRLYALRTTDGELIWKTPLPDSQRWLPGNQRLISTLPLRSGVAVLNGQLRFAAGLFPREGTYQYAADPSDGRLLAQGQLPFSPQGYLSRKGNQLRMGQGRAPQVDLSTLKPQARQRAAAEQVEYEWIEAGGTRIIARPDHVVALSDTGVEVWRQAFAHPPLGLALADQRLIVSLESGEICCFASRDQLANSGSVAGQSVRETPRPLPDTKLKAPSVLPFSPAACQDWIPPRGYILVAGSPAVSFLVELAAMTHAQIIVPVPDAQRADAMRRRLFETGYYGQIVIHDEVSAGLPYASGIFDVVIDARGPQDSVDEAALLSRVKPAGGLIVWGTNDPTSSLPTDWTRCQDLPTSLGVIWQRGRLAGEGEWTHMYADAGNTCCSQDQRVRNSLRLQWFGRPGAEPMVDRHHRTVPPLYCNGQMFVPGNEQLFGVDAYNGTIRWHRELEGFRRVGVMRDSGNMVATPDALFVVVKNRCLVLNPSDGSTLEEILVPESDTHDWGYLGQSQHWLVGSVTEPNASRDGHSREQIAETYYDAIPIVTSHRIFAQPIAEISQPRVASPTRRWIYQARGAILNPTIALDNQTVFFVECDSPDTLASPQGRHKLQDLAQAGLSIVSLRLTDGQVLYRRSIPLERLEHHVYLMASENKLLIVGSRNQQVSGQNLAHFDVLCLNQTDGTTVWSASQNQNKRAGGSHGEQDHHPAIVGSRLLVEPYAYDLSTGQRVTDWAMLRHGHGCGTVSASAHALFFRAGNPTMCDLETGEQQRVTQVSRPGCWINIIPAGGLVLIPEASSGCTCDFPIQASLAFAPPELELDPRSNLRRDFSGN